VTKSILHKILSIATIVILLLPIGLQLAHTLEYHEHTICNSEDVQHIHKQELDCSIYHLKIHTESQDLNNTFLIAVENIKNSIPLFLAKESEPKSRKSQTVRGPPKFII